MATTYSNILIIKPSALGDIVHALPVLSALRTALPAARITWMVRQEFAPLLACVKELDEVLLFDRRRLGRWYYRPGAFKALWNFIRTLRKSRYDLVLDLQGLLRTGLFARITGCPRRIGMADSREFAKLFYTHKVPRPQNSIHVLDYYHACLKQAGIEIPPAREIVFNVPDTAVASVHQTLERAGVRDNYFVLIPSSAHPDKCWPAERFAKLAEYVNRRFDFTPVIVGAQKDKPVIDTIKSHSGIRLIDLTGKTTILELVALLQKAAGVVSNDTGPGHIAAALHVPTVLIFGHTNPMRVAPYGRPACVAAVDPDRRSPQIESADPAHRIEQVPYELVIEKITMQLKNHPPGTGKGNE